MAILLFLLTIAALILLAVLPFAYVWGCVLIQRRLRVRLGSIWANRVFFVSLSIPFIYCAVGMLYVRHLSLSDTTIPNASKVKSEGVFVEGNYAHAALDNDLKSSSGFSFYESKQPDGSLYRTHRLFSDSKFVAAPISDYGFSVSPPEPVASPLGISISIAKVWDLATQVRLAERKQYLFGGGLLGNYLVVLFGTRYLTYEVNSGFKLWRAGGFSDLISSYPAWEKDIDFLKTVVDPRVD
ncbi:MAG: hypothetical protein HYX45_07900 [Burkholderiales bacterium]|nr:hypothetical protein [Burkholderiales bacterium]